VAEVGSGACLGLGSKGTW